MTLYSQVLNSFALPVVYGIRGRHFAKNAAFLQESQWWPPEEIASFQWRELRRLVDHAISTCPFYREKYGAVGLRSAEDIRDWDDFRRLPYLSRDEVKSNGSELRSQCFTGRVYQHGTSGSSGVPMKFYASVDSYDWRCAATARAYGMSGYRLGEKTMFLWGAPLTPPSFWKRLKIHAQRTSRREIYFNTFIHSEQLWDEVLEATKRFQPRFVVGYVSSLEEFSRYVLNRGEKLGGIQAVISAAEAVTQTSVELVAAAFGAPLYNAYGARETMSIAAECEYHDGLHINEENVVVECSSTDPLGSGEAIITDLHNYAMPFIRYRIGDTITLYPPGQRCACGRGLRKIRSLDGRTCDMLTTADGQVFTGLWFILAMIQFPEVDQFQVIQRMPDEIIVSLLMQSGEISSVQERLAKAFAGRFGTSTRIRCQGVESLEKTKSGKRKIVIRADEQLEGALR